MFNPCISQDIGGIAEPFAVLCRAVALGKGDFFDIGTAVEGSTAVTYLCRNRHCEFFYSATVIESMIADARNTVRNCDAC